MPEPLTANQVVAYNLTRVRKMLGLSQEQAAERLEPHLGTRWSKAVYSAAERSFHGNRIRQFTADDLTAFSLAFGVPVAYFFVPPKPEDREGSGPQPEFLKVILGGENTHAVLMRAGELPNDEVPYAVRLRLIYTYAPPASVQMTTGDRGRELTARFPEIMPRSPADHAADFAQQVARESGISPEQLIQELEKLRGRPFNEDSERGDE
jgi:transcriptional regulator with XRE-family HTH domain